MNNISGVSRNSNLSTEIKQKFNKNLSSILKNAVII